MTNYLITDVSAWEGRNINYTIMASSNCKGVYFKASEGLTSDSTFVINNVNSKNKGLLRGAFHFLRWEYSPTVQANMFWNLVKNEKYDFPLGVDLEWNPGVITPPNAIHIAYDFIEALKVLSGTTKFMLYTSLGFMNELNSFTTNPADKLLLNNKQYWDTTTYLWLQDIYAKSFPMGNRVPKQWSEVALWQQTFVGSGITYGISPLDAKGVDINYLSEKYYNLFSGNNVTTTPVVITPPTTVIPKDDDMLKMKVIVNNLNVRTLPSTNGAALYQLKKGDIVDVYNVGGMTSCWINLSPTGESKWCCVQDSNRVYLQKVIV